MTTPVGNDPQSRYVRDHLTGRGLAPHRLTITTEPAWDSYNTIVRIADRNDTWTEQYADQLHDALHALPGHPYVRRSAIRNRMAVIWNGPGPEHNPLRNTTYAQRTILAALIRLGGTGKAIDVAYEASHTTAYVTPMLDNLVNLGLVARSTSHPFPTYTTHLTTASITT